MLFSCICSNWRNHHFDLCNNCSNKKKIHHLMIQKLLLSIILIRCCLFIIFLPSYHLKQSFFSWSCYNQFTFCHTTFSILCSCVQWFLVIFIMICLQYFVNVKIVKHEQNHIWKIFFYRIATYSIFGSLPSPSFFSCFAQTDISLK